MEKIAVIGGAGYIGSHTVRQLKNAGYDLAVIDDLSTGTRDALSSDIKFYQVSILQLNELRDVFKKENFTAVLHFAAKLSVPESFKQFDLYYQTNVTGTHHLLMMCREFNIKKFVFSSTAAVYGNCPESFVDEYQALKPQNPYGLTKKMAEELLAGYATTVANFNYKILRYFNVAGAESDLTNGPRNYKSGQLLLNLCLKAIDRSPVEIFGTQYPTADGTAVRDYIHVVDLAAAHLEALRNISMPETSAIWNCGYGRGYSVREVIRAFEQANSIKLEQIERPPRQGDPAVVVAKNDRIRSESQWMPLYDDLQTICRTSYDWIKRTHDTH